MSEEVQLIYMNLNQLLDDICKFLKDGVNREALSPESRKQADNLIRRSKVQLQKISTITSEINTSDYIDMQTLSATVPIEPKVEPEIIVTEQLITPTIEKIERCPYSDVSTKGLPQKEKEGYISWKTKFFFGFEKQRRIYAVVCGDWLLIYYNEKDSKPYHSYNLKYHKAQMVVTSKQCENKTPYFNLVHNENKLITQFMSHNNKDMLQWVTKINRVCQMKAEKLYERKNENTIANNILESIKTYNDDEDDEGETYADIIIAKPDKMKTEVTEENEEEDLYIDIDYRPSPPAALPARKEILFLPPFKMDIPARMQKTPLPPLPIEKQISEESLASYDNPQKTEKWDNDSVIEESRDSFSESEEDIYDIPQTQTLKMKPPVSPIKKDEVIESFRPPVMPKPKIDVKLLKNHSNGKPSTKEILKMAKENSLR